MSQQGLVGLRGGSCLLDSPRDPDMEEARRTSAEAGPPGGPTADLGSAGWRGSRRRATSPPPPGFRQHLSGLLEQGSSVYGDATGQPWLGSGLHVGAFPKVGVVTTPAGGAVRGPGAPGGAAGPTAPASLTCPAAAARGVICCPGSPRACWPRGCRRRSRRSCSSCRRTAAPGPPRCS